ncbi:MAG: fibronectin type III domain-containing protein [Oscillospiraceae bacterium]|jgi:nitrate reductase cytochrome c-type subunit|nr:fibronectin type III domain-containing protein [Oscillospiraceae bacterium]
MKCSKRVFLILMAMILVAFAAAAHASAATFIGATVGQVAVSNTKNGARTAVPQGTSVSITQGSPLYFHGAITLGGVEGGNAMLYLGLSTQRGGGYYNSLFYGWTPVASGTSDIDDHDFAQLFTRLPVGTYYYSLRSDFGGNQAEVYWCQIQVVAANQPGAQPPTQSTQRPTQSGQNAVRLTANPVTNIYSSGAKLSVNISPARYVSVAGHEVQYANGRPCKTNSFAQYVTLSKYELNIGGLRESTAYRARLYVVVDNVTYYGAWQNFTTSTQTAPTKPTTQQPARPGVSITTDPVTNIYSTGCTMSIHISPARYVTIAGHEVQYANGSPCKTNGYQQNAALSQYKLNLGGLRAGTAYRARLYVTINNRIYYGDWQYFNTTGGSAQAPVAVYTGKPTNVSRTRASVAMSVSPASLVKRVGYILQYANGRSIKADAFDKNQTLSSAGFTLKGLKPGTHYQVQAYAIVNGKIYYGNWQSFSTLQ